MYESSLLKLREWAKTEELTASEEGNRKGNVRTGVVGSGVKPYKPSKSGGGGFMGGLSRGFDEAEKEKVAAGDELYKGVLAEGLGLMKNAVSDGDVVPEYAVKDGWGKGYDTKGPNKARVAEILKEESELRGVDYSMSFRVSKGEGFDTYDSQVPRGGTTEPSYGPMQLFMAGGLGNSFLKDTGINPKLDRSEASIRKQFQYSLDYAVENGWGAWFGAAASGVGKWDGLKGAKPVYNWKG